MTNEEYEELFAGLSTNTTYDEAVIRHVRTCTKAESDCKICSKY